jgi:hypothetical protein
MKESLGRNVQSYIGMQRERERGGGGKFVEFQVWSLVEEKEDQASRAVVGLLILQFLWKCKKKKEKKKKKKQQKKIMIQLGEKLLIS